MQPYPAVWYIFCEVAAIYPTMLMSCSVLIENIFSLTGQKYLSDNGDQLLSSHCVPVCGVILGNRLIQHHGQQLCLTRFSFYCYKNHYWQPLLDSQVSHQLFSIKYKLNLKK